VLADIEERIAKLQTTADGVRQIMAMSGTSPSGGSGGKIAHVAFLKMSIPDAPKSA
jgi:hypothetical protein